MKKLFLVLITLLNSPSVSFASSNESISLSRVLVVETCDNAGKCTPVETSKLEPSAVIELSKFNKANGQGFHGENKFKVVIEEVPFKGEIFVNKVGEGYSIYTVLRSGYGTNRNGVTQKVFVKDVSESKPIILTDKPILIKGKSYQAKLTIQAIGKVSSN